MYFVSIGKILCMQSQKQKTNLLKYFQIFWLEKRIYQYKNTILSEKTLAFKHC